MIEDMGIFRTTVGVASLSDPQRRVDVEQIMVDTGSEYTWIAEERLAQLGVAPVRSDRFETADGRILERRVGFAMLYAGGTPWEGGFAEAGVGYVHRTERFTGWPTEDNPYATLSTRSRTTALVLTTLEPVTAD